MPILSEVIHLQEVPTKFHGESQEGYINSRLSSEMFPTKGTKASSQEESQEGFGNALAFSAIRQCSQTFS
jgi:hypothetical protein